MAKYATSVASQATQLKDVGGSKLSSKNAIATACYQHHKSINRSIVRSAIDSTSSRVHQAFKYARDEYTYGLPNGYLINSELVDTQRLEEVIEAEVGFEVDIQIAFMSEANPLIVARDYAAKHWGYKPSSDNGDRGYLTNPPFTPEDGHRSTVFSGDFLDGGFLNIALTTDYTPPKEIPNTGIFTPEKYDTYNVRVKPDELDWNINPNGYYYHVRYVPKGAVDTGYDYWFYEVGTGTYPDLDDVSTETGEPFLPVVPLREFNRNLGPEIEGAGTPDVKFKRNAQGNKIVPDTELYRTSKKLLQKTGVDMDEVCLLIAGNESIDDIDHTYITYGIDIRTETKEGKKYLYQFFRELALNSPNKSELEIRDAQYKVNIKYDSATLVTKTGVLDDETKLIYTNDGDILTIRRQVSDTEYDEIVVSNLLHVNYIFKNHTEITSIEDSADPENFGFLVPIQYNLIKQDRSLFGRQDLLDESLVLIFNCYERRKLKWYETGFFKFLVIIVAVVLSVWSGGASLFLTSLGTAIAGGILSTIIFLATTIGVALAVQYGLEWAVEELGLEWAAALAVVISIAAIATGQFGLATESLSLMSVDGLLAAVSGIAANLSTVTDAGLEQISDEAEAFAQFAEDELDALIALEDELWEVGYIGVDDILTRKHNDFFGETPDEFYNRTIHSGNIGSATLDLISVYVDTQLKLPELNKIR